MENAGSDRKRLIKEDNGTSVKAPQTSYLRSSMQTIILSVLVKEEQLSPTHTILEIEKKRTTCRLCPSQKRRMTRNYCVKCLKPFCLEHRAEMCKKCESETMVKKET